MKNFFFSIFFLVLSSFLCAQSVKDFNRTAFYQALASDSKEMVNREMKLLETAPAEIREAFIGALTMRKADFAGPPAKKLTLFRIGHRKLETAIKRAPGNIEFRFLRLIIQENAPGILGYKNDLQEDSEQIRKFYKSLPEEVQRAIEDYSKKSKILKLQVS